MKKLNDNNKLAIQMLIAMISGILVGLLFMGVREANGSDSSLWLTINKILFQLGLPAEIVEWQGSDRN